jgi:lysozyme
MRTSAAGIALIKQFEGCKLTAYVDAIGMLTIGYGHTGPDVRPGMTITQQEAQEFLARRLANEFEPGVMEGIGYTRVSQPQFDAMVSLAYNIGVGAFSGSSIARLHRTGDYAGAADAFLKWNRAGGRVLRGLTHRREEERKLYLSGEAAPAPDIKPLAIDRDLLADMIRATQRVVGATPDGVFGDETITKIQEAQRQL